MTDNKQIQHERTTINKRIQRERERDRERKIPTPVRARTHQDKTTHDGRGVYDSRDADIDADHYTAEDTHDDDDDDDHGNNGDEKN